MTTPTITVSPVPDFAALGRRWRDLESRARPSFFQTWTWTGCLAAERFTRPVLVEAREGGRTVALALFNRRGRTLYLGESGDPARDAVWIEFNGVLTESGREAALTQACLHAARASGVFGPRALVMSGLGPEAMALSEGLGPARVVRTAPAPFADLTDGPEAYLARRSANTRQQLRRSNRSYAGAGPLAIARATDQETSLEFLDRLAVLHQAAWTARGRPGAFADPFFGRFHKALIAEGFPRGEIDLYRVSAGPREIGYLYNFRHGFQSLAYQSGFDYGAAGPYEKPGLTSHHMAIQAAGDRGARRYDFLAGDDRYKRSLSDAAETVSWVEIAAPFSPRAWARRVRSALPAWVTCAR